MLYPFTLVNLDAQTLICQINKSYCKISHWLQILAKVSIWRLGEHPMKHSIMDKIWCCCFLVPPINSSILYMYVCMHSLKSDQHKTVIILWEEDNAKLLYLVLKVSCWRTKNLSARYTWLKDCQSTGITFEVLSKVVLHHLLLTILFFL